MEWWVVQDCFFRTLYHAACHKWSFWYVYTSTVYSNIQYNHIHAYLKLRWPIVLALRKGLVEVLKLSFFSSSLEVRSCRKACWCIFSRNSILQTVVVGGFWREILFRLKLQMQPITGINKKSPVLHPKSWQQWHTSPPSSTTRILTIFLLPCWFTKSYVIHAIHPVDTGELLACFKFTRNIQTNSIDKQFLVVSLM